MLESLLRISVVIVFHGVEYATGMEDGTAKATIIRHERQPVIGLRVLAVPAEGPSVKLI